MLMKFVLLSDVRDCDPGFCKRWLGCTRCGVRQVI